MEELQARHRKEQRDLQSRITQKKKAASKKTRKGVNDECVRLETELKDQQASEIAALTGEPSTESNLDPPGSDIDNEKDVNGTNDATAALKEMNLNDLAAKPPQRPEQTDAVTSAQQQNGPQKKPNRQKARLARRAAEQEAAAEQAEREAQDLPRLREIEREKFLKEFGKRGLQEKEIRADGHCLYSAVADQLAVKGMRLTTPLDATAGDEDKQEGYRIVRRTAAGFIEANKEDFEPFLEEPLEEYVKKIRDTGEWGGQLELLALARSYGVKIHVLQGDGRVETIEGAGEGDDQIWLAYYRHGFGLGEHYNSLRKVG